jgi:hypothetical protein
MRMPCTLNILGDDIIIPDLKGRITILGKDNKLIAHLGENSDPKLQGQNPIPPEKWKDGEFISRTERRGTRRATSTSRTGTPRAASTR